MFAVGESQAISQANRRANTRNAELSILEGEDLTLKHPLERERRLEIQRRKPQKWRRHPSHTLPIRVCAAQPGRDFEAPDLDRGIHFRAGARGLLFQRRFLERGKILRTQETAPVL